MFVFVFSVCATQETGISTLQSGYLDWRLDHARPYILLSPDDFSLLVKIRSAVKVLGAVEPRESSTCAKKCCGNFFSIISIFIEEVFQAHTRPRVALRPPLFRSRQARFTRPRPQGSGPWYTPRWSEDADIPDNRCPRLISGLNDVKYL